MGGAKGGYSGGKAEIKIEYGKEGYKVTGSGDAKADKMLGLYMNATAPSQDQIKGMGKQEGGQALQEIMQQGVQVVTAMLKGDQKAAQLYLSTTLMGPLAKASEYGALAKDPMQAKQISDSLYKNTKNAAKTLKETGAYKGSGIEIVLDLIGKASNVEEALKGIQKIQSSAAASAKGGGAKAPAGEEAAPEAE